jgi:hypothetical protein
MAVDGPRLLHAPATERPRPAPRRNPRTRASAAVDIERVTIMLVGHEERLSDLVTQLTGSRRAPLLPAAAVAIEDDDPSRLHTARGRIHFRYPVVDHQETELRPKVQSKMAVASFLAGFVSAALVTVLSMTGGRRGWSGAARSTHRAARRSPRSSRSLSGSTTNRSEAGPSPTSTRRKQRRTAAVFLDGWHLAVVFTPALVLP